MASIRILLSGNVFRIYANLTEGKDDEKYYNEKYHNC